MKVPGQNGPRATTEATAPRPAGARRGDSAVQAAPGAQRVAPGESAAVVVSTSTARVSDLERAAEAQQAARVEDLKGQVERGEYQVDKDRLAERLAEEELARAPK